MRFEIHRASLGAMSDAQPCDEAVRDGHDWFVEIEDLPALTRFSEKYGDLIFDTRSIWIYDDYME